MGRLGDRDRPLLGPLRASVPIVAGITQMPWLRFQIANWSSAFLWAFVLLSPGHVRPEVVAGLFLLNGTREQPRP